MNNATHNNEPSKPSPDDANDDTEIRGKGLGGISFRLPVRRGDVRWIVYALALSTLILAICFGISLLK